METLITIVFVLVAMTGVLWALLDARDERLRDEDWDAHCADAIGVTR